MCVFISYSHPEQIASELVSNFTVRPFVMHKLSLSIKDALRIIIWRKFSVSQMCNFVAFQCMQYTIIMLTGNNPLYNR